MLKPKRSSIVIETYSDLANILNANWNDYGAPFKPLFYISYRKSTLLFCTVIARDCFGKLKSLPWQYNGKDMRGGLNGRHID
jgi:hypothetical protein